MKLTKEQALKLHRQMWSDMQKELGDNPKEIDRIHFKKDWACSHFPEERILNNCFLCEYTSFKKLDCDKYPIVWHNGHCANYYLEALISKILALPERTR